MAAPRTRAGRRPAAQAATERDPPPRRLAAHDIGDHVGALIAARVVGAPSGRATRRRIGGACIADWVIRDELEAAGERGLVGFWCCGVRDTAPLDPVLVGRCLFAGVRGPTSRDVLGLPADVVLGDVGLLAPLAHEAAREGRTAGRTVCLPSLDEGRPDALLRDLSGADEIVRPPEGAPSEAGATAVIDALASAAFVLCGTPDAAVLAHAYGVPFAFWDGGQGERAVAWQDVAGGLGIPAVFVRSVAEGREAHAALIEPAARPVPLLPILAAAPFAIRPGVYERAYARDGREAERGGPPPSGRRRSVGSDTASDATSEARGEDEGEGGTVSESDETARFRDFVRRVEDLERLVEEGAREKVDLADRLAERERQAETALRRLADDLAEAEGERRRLQVALSDVSVGRLAETQERVAGTLARMAADLDAVRSALDDRARLREAEAEREVLRAQAMQDRIDLAAAQDRLIAAVRDWQDTAEKLGAAVAGRQESERALREAMEAQAAAAGAREDVLRADWRAALDARDAVEAESRRALAEREAAMEALRAETAAALAAALARGRAEAERAETLHAAALDAATRAAADSERERLVASIRDGLARELADAARVVRGWMSRRAPEPAAALADIEGGSTLCEALLFDPDYYVRHLPAGTEPGTSALSHYLTQGWRQGLSPSPLFHNDWYLFRHAEAVPPGMSPLSHYVRHGAAQGLQPHPCFDRHYYVTRYPEAVRHAPDPFQHFVRQGLGLNCFPSGMVEAAAGGRLSAADCLGVLLGDAVAPPAPATGAGAPWPPAPVDDYWLPQALRDYVFETFGDGPIPVLSYLMSLIARHESDPGAFGASAEAAVLAQRLRSLAAGHAGGEAPDASIVVPVHDNCLYTLTCLVSLLEFAGTASFEVIVGDDRSTDETAALVGAIGGNVRLVTHPENEGFLGNCNACAALARGRVIVFLNNDTLVLPGWLDALLAPFAEASVGLVGSKLINGDGTLQEAGGILWADGSAWNFGRGDDPRLPAYSYRKDVDYCSGASIAVPRALWQDLDGFDTAFRPAYCEDSDLALRLRAAGYRTLLEPFSLVIHHEGRSHGRDVAQGLKAYQVVNQAKLLERWGATLAAENLPNGERVFLARDRSRGKPHILVVDHYIPEWDRDAGSRTMFHFVRTFLERGFHVTLWPDNLYRTPDYARRFQELGVEVIYGPDYVDGFDRWYGAVKDELPYVLLSRPQIADRFIDRLDRARTKVLYYGHDLHWKRLEAEHAVTGQESVLAEMTRMREQELSLCARADVALYPSADEIAVLRAELPEATALDIPAWTFETSELDRLARSLAAGPGRDPRHILFVGGFQHGPNVDGVRWFMDEVWPLLTARDDALRITIAGSKPPDSVRAFAWNSPFVTVTGFVSDAALDDLYAGAGAAIVPLRFGGGVKGKVIEAFAKGIPVVATSVGVQGIPDGADLAFVADDPAAFAQGVLAALREAEAASAKVRAAAAFVAREYSTDALAARLAPHVPEMGRSGDASA